MPTGIVPAIGRPGVGSSVTAQRLGVSRGGELGFFPGGGTIEGTKTRDTGNSTGVRSLRPGLLMGRITASGYYANSIIGLNTVLHDTSVVTTVMTLPAVVVTEISRRIGASGTFKITGPPTAAGTVATETVTYSAIASSTTLTITATSADFAAGSLIRPTDGSETPITFIPDGYNLLIDEDGNDISFPRIPVSGIIDQANLIDWSSDTSVRTFLRAALSTDAGGKFVFADQFSS